GKDVAACWSYACHPVGFPVLNDLSAEYPGLVRHMIRASCGDIPVVFWQGFSGNIAPLQVLDTHSTVGAPAAHGLRAHTMKEWRHWASGLGQCVIATAAGQGSPIQGPVSYDVRSLPVHALGLSSGKELCLHEIALG